MRKDKKHNYIKYAEAWEKKGAVITIVAVLLCLVPIMILGLYNYPTGDDYYYAATTKQVFVQTGSVLETIGSAFAGVCNEYVEWQGTYSAMFLMYLTPTVWGEWLYSLVTTVMLLLMLAGIYYGTKPIFCGFLKLSLSMHIILSGLFLLLCIETVPFQGESFFWYNGSMYYTGYWAISWLFIGMVLRFLQHKKMRYKIALPFLAVFLAGGNYVTLLPVMELMALLLLVLSLWQCEKAKKLLQKKDIQISDSWDKGTTLYLWFVFLLMVAGLVVSMKAPGNMVRSGGEWAVPPMKAVALALLQGISYLNGWPDRWLFMAIIVFIPLFWKTYDKAGLSFRYPGLVVLVAYGIFCSMGCPTFLGENSPGPARVLAVVFYNFLTFILFSVYYVLGYVHHWYRKKHSEKSAVEKGRNVAPICVAAGVLMLLLGLQIYNESFKELTTVKALRELRSGEAQLSFGEYQERLRILEDPKVQDVVFKPFVYQPDMIHVGDFQIAADNPNNLRVAQYFGKKSLMVDYSTDKKEEEK